MGKIHGSRIRDVINRTKVGEQGEFKAHVTEGIENFTNKRVFKASVSSGFQGAGGYFFWDNFEEAEIEAKSLLISECKKFELEMEQLRKQYDSQ